ncbi:Fungal transcriptional regulatory [Cordyceps militaris]|uniref:Fungal transcriptional regulatory n=1 Tax=Cordyceps militaris TaxID=73501 RepID=A0A2H4SCB6_CORMI|nr:Fungal transcriptional regulatory [Cordyceps militaris]
MSRAADIPDNLMGKWQSDQNRSTRAPRRPMTACQTCRASKVKCDGKQRCRHCTLRGVACVYTNSRNTTARASGAVRKCSPKAHMSAVPDDAHQHMWPAPLPTANTREMHGVENAGRMAWNRAPFLSSDQNIYLHVHENPVSMESRLHSGLGIMEPLADYNALLPDSDLQLDFSCSINRRCSIAISDCTADALYSMHQTSDAESAGHTNTTRPSSSGPPSQSPSDGVFFSAHCPCREALSRSVGEINDALLSHKTTSDIFHVTSAFLHTCRGVLDCSLCTLHGADLVCLVSCLQQTASCFHYMAATTDPKHEAVLRLRLADTVVPVTDPRMRLMAMTTLVQHAVYILDAIGHSARCILHASSPPTPLVMSHVGYLENTIGDFRTTLDYVVAVAEQNARQSN